MTTTTFIGLGATWPHDPLHATETCEPVEPSSIPIAGAKLNGTSCSAPTRMVLHVMGEEFATEVPGFQLLPGLGVQRTRHGAQRGAAGHVHPAAVVARERFWYDDIRQSVVADTASGLHTPAVEVVLGIWYGATWAGVVGVPSVLVLRATTHQRSTSATSSAPSPFFAK